VVLLFNGLYDNMHYKNEYNMIIENGILIDFVADFVYVRHICNGQLVLYTVLTAHNCINRGLLLYKKQSTPK
jgi:hypothetical protein